MFRAIPGFRPYQYGLGQLQDCRAVLVWHMCTYEGRIESIVLYIVRIQGYECRNLERDRYIRQGYVEIAIV